jgi:hypothetical protein
MTRLWVAVGRIETGYKHTAHGGFDIAALRVRRVAWQRVVRDDRLYPAREDGHPIP